MYLVVHVVSIVMSVLLMIQYTALTKKSSVPNNSMRILDYAGIPKQALFGGTFDEQRLILS